LIRERLQERDVLVGEGADVIAPDENHADAFPLPEHWRENHRLIANRLACPARLLRHVLAVLNVWVMDDAAGKYRGYRATAIVHRERKDLLESFSAGAMVGTEAKEAVFSHQV